MATSAISKTPNDSHQKGRDVFSKIFVAAMSSLLVISVVGATVMWRNQGIIQATRFTAEDGRVFTLEHSRLRLELSEFQIEVLKLISELPPKDWKDRINTMENKLDDLRIEVARHGNSDNGTR